MKKKEISIVGFNINENELAKIEEESNKNKEKVKGRRPPCIQTITKERKSNTHGAALEISNYKALKLMLDDQIIKEKDFGKIFPNSFIEFNIKHTWSTSKTGKKIEKTYFYFPKGMIENHQIVVRYRQKMQEIIYEIKLEEKLDIEI